jgi:hypothetical protein
MDINTYKSVIYGMIAICHVINKHFFLLSLNVILPFINWLMFYVSRPESQLHVYVQGYRYWYLPPTIFLYKKQAVLFVEESGEPDVTSKFYHIMWYRVHLTTCGNRA